MVGSRGGWLGGGGVQGLVDRGDGVKGWVGRGWWGSRSGRVGVVGSRGCE